MSARSTDNQAARFGGIAWIICAGLTGYLALQQFSTASSLKSLGFDPGDLEAFALWNGIAAALTVYFGVRLLQRPNRGFLGTSAAWGALSVLGGVYQASSGATNDVFLGSIVAAGMAGILSFAARSVEPEETRPSGSTSSGPVWERDPFREVLPPAATAVRPPMTPAVAGATTRPATGPDVPVELGETEATPHANDGRSRRTAILVASGVILAVVALAIVIMQMGSGGGVGAAPPTPTSGASPSTPTPTRGRTLTALTPGKITFDSAKYRVGAQATYVALLNQIPPLDAIVRLQFVQGSTVIAEGTVDGAVATALNGVLTVPDMAPGTYVVRILANGIFTLSQGTVTLTK